MHRKFNSGTHFSALEFRKNVPRTANRCSVGRGWGDVARRVGVGVTSLALVVRESATAGRRSEVVLDEYHTGVLIQVLGSYALLGVLGDIDRAVSDLETAV